MKKKKRNTFFFLSEIASCSCCSFRLFKILFFLNPFFRDISSLFSKILSGFLYRTYSLNLKKKKPKKIHQIILPWGFVGLSISSKCHLWGLVNPCLHLDHNMTITCFWFSASPLTQTELISFWVLKFLLYLCFFLVQRIRKSYLLTSCGEKSLKGTIK